MTSDNENEKLAASIQNALDKEDDSVAANDTKSILQKHYQLQEIQELGQQFCKMLDGLGSKRHYSIAKTHIETAVLWAKEGLTK